VSRAISLLLLSRSLLSIFSGSLMLLAVPITGLAGCKRGHDIAVRVSIPGPDSIETPAAGVGIIALPYDRDSVLASMEARAPTPRPHTAALDSLFARFRSPFTTYTNLSYALGELRDSLGRLRTRLNSMPRGSAEYRTLLARADRLSDSLAALESRA
jgi:hypothetical protein